MTKDELDYFEEGLVKAVKINCQSLAFRVVRGEILDVGGLSSVGEIIGSAIRLFYHRDPPGPHWTRAGLVFYAFAFCLDGVQLWPLRIVAAVEMVPERLNRHGWFAVSVWSSDELGWVPIRRVSNIPSYMSQKIIADHMARLGIYTNGRIHIVCKGFTEEPCPDKTEIPRLP